MTAHRDRQLVSPLLLSHAGGLTRVRRLCLAEQPSHLCGLSPVAAMRPKTQHFIALYGTLCCGTSVQYKHLLLLICDLLMMPPALPFFKFHYPCKQNDRNEYIYRLVRASLPFRYSSLHQPTLSPFAMGLEEEPLARVHSLPPSTSQAPEFSQLSPPSLQLPLTH